MRYRSRRRFFTLCCCLFVFFFSSRRRHTRYWRDWSSDVCSSDLEIVIVGGTFPFMPADYQRHFAKSCYDALNGEKSSTLQQAIASNEIAENRCVGFTVETKPDYCKGVHIDLMLELGVTRIEIGVQSLNNKVYKLVNRGHTLDDVIHAFKVARDAGYKIVAHMMPGLPGSSPKEDIEDFRRLFEDDSFKPDMLTIYPTLVLEHTGLFNMHKSGKYQAYSDDELVNIIVEAKDRKSTRLNSSHANISYAVFCLKKKKINYYS